MKITKRELRQMIDESVYRALNESADPFEHDFKFNVNEIDLICMRLENLKGAEFENAYKREFKKLFSDYLQGGKVSPKVKHALDLYSKEGDKSEYLKMMKPALELYCEKMTPFPNGIR